jgi:hypothetical protein
VAGPWQDFSLNWLEQGINTSGSCRRNKITPKTKTPKNENPGTKHLKEGQHTLNLRLTARPVSTYNINLQAPLPVMCPVAWPVVSPMALARPEFALASSSQLKLLMKKFF